ncbi:MAG: prepilin-type N-terminal cleavage/methylation domain-containing protein [Deltaproteobacteria bacterium]|nr:prepilin-type N-terminal cleavage/methylation domain-containing protein [Deltaproteobacteria bacterium]
MSATGHRPAPRAAGGFTMIEIMMSIVIFSAAALGLLAFEHALMRSNADSNDITSATYVGDFWLESARAESRLWNQGATSLTAARTPLLAPIAPGLATANTTTGWLALPIMPNRPVPAQPLNRYLEVCPTGGACDFAEYCVQYRLTVLIPDEVLRMEVRVLWFKEGANHGSLTPVAQTCPAIGMMAGSDPDLSKVHLVQLASTLWQNAVTP